MAAAIAVSPGEYTELGDDAAARLIRSSWLRGSDVDIKSSREVRWMGVNFGGIAPPAFSYRVQTVQITVRRGAAGGTEVAPGAWSFNDNSTIHEHRRGHSNSARTQQTSTPRISAPAVLTPKSTATMAESEKVSVYNVAGPPPLSPSPSSIKPPTNPPPQT